MDRNTKKFIDKINSHYKNEYELVSEYFNSETDVKILHKKCGNIYNVKPHTFLRKSNSGKCPFCEINSKNMTQEQFEYKLDLLVGEEYSLVEFNGYTKGFTLLHTKCGNHVNFIGDRFFNRGNRCRYCSHRSFKYTTKEYSDLISSIDYSYILKSEYINEKTKIKLLHTKCGNEWSVLPRNFVYNNNRCPICNEIQSKKAFIIENILSDNNISFEKEKTFENCKNKRKLPFDFYIPELDILIEFDGEQHFKEMRFTDASNKLKYIRNNDNIKNLYCLNNNKKLLRLHYKLNNKSINIILSELINNKYLSSTTIEKYNLYYLNNINNYYTYLDNNLYLVE